MPTFSGLKSKGDRAFRHDDLLQAISYYTDAISIDPTNQEVLGCRSAVYSKLGMYNEAKNDAERLIIAVPNNPKGYFIKAVALENLGNHTDSLKCFLSAYERDSRHPLELVLHIVQVSGCICQLSEDEELDLPAEGDIDDDSKKFQALVQIGKRFCKNKDYKFCNAVLKTAMTSHCSLSKASYWLESSDGGNNNTLKHDFEQTACYHGDDITDSTKTHAFSSMYLTTGFQGDASFHGNLKECQLDEHIEKSPRVDSSTVMSALITLCLSYLSLGQYQQALIYSKQCLQLALERDSKKYELKSYVHLANIYQKLGEYLQAISYNAKLLAVGRDVAKGDVPSRDYKSFWGLDEERKALWNLSAAYKSLGDIKKALHYAKEYLELLKSVNEENLTLAYSNFGELELCLGNLDAALEYHKMELRFSRKFDDKVAVSYAYGNIGKVYAVMGNQTLSEINHSQHMKVAQSIGDKLSELVAVRQLGDMYRLMDDHAQALEQYDKYLLQVKTNNYEMLQCQVYAHIGFCYWKLNQLYRAQHNYELSLKLATELSEKEEELSSRFCLAKIMKSLRQYEKCRQYYNEVIPVLEQRLFVKQGNNIIYEDEITVKLTDCYEDLQEVLVEMNYTKEALEISEHCNSRVLVNILRCKEILKENDDSREPSDLSPNTAEEIFKLVDSSDRLVLVYSRLKDGFISWLLSPAKDISKFHRYKNCDHVGVEERIRLCIEDLHSNHLCNVKCDQRSLPQSNTASDSHENENPQTTKSCSVCTFSTANSTPLQRLHEILLEPFSEQLHNSDIRRLAIVPAATMTMVPFPSLQNTSRECLYESFQVSMMPCIRALSLTSTSQTRSTTDKDIKILVAGNPTIPNVNLNGTEWRPPGHGNLAELEVTSLATLLGVEPVTGCQATTENILEMLSKSSVAHLVTYGSWKKGCLAFAPNKNCYGDPPCEESYLITVSDLLALDLTTKLVVLSSCFSCSHKFCYLKQVNLSLATALLASGVQAVICPLWSVEQPELLKLYCHLYTGLEKGETVANALNEAYNQVKSMDKYSNPVYWSSHVMIGFDTTIDLPRLRHKLFNALLHRQVNTVVSTRFSVKMRDTQDNKAKANKLKEFLTSLMLQHGWLPDILPALRDLVKLANSMLAACEEGQNMDQIVMSTCISSVILDAPFCRHLLLFLGFSFQSDGAKNKDPYVVFPHWDYDNLVEASAVILDAVCTMFDISGMAGHSLARLLKTVTHSNMEKLKELLAITTKYPTRIVKTSDFIVRSLWCNTDVQRFLVAIGFYEVGQSLLFNKSNDNHSMVKGALHVVSALLGRIKAGTSRLCLPVRELSSETSVKLVSLSPLITATNQIVMGTPWMSKRSQPDEAKLKLKFARELESINKDFGGIVTRSNYWHAQLLRAKTSQTNASLPIISQSYPSPLQAPPATKHRLKVKVISGLTPSCDRRLAEEEPTMTLHEARERRNAIYKIYGQRYDDIAMRKRNEIRQLFVSFAEESK